MSDRVKPGSVHFIDHPLVQHKLSIMRESATSTGQFRCLLREIAPLLAYEATRDLVISLRTIDTPLQKMDAPCLAGRKMALISILRAGNGLLDGVLDLVPCARVGFVGLYRDERTLRPVQYYSKLPDHLDQRVILLLDPMLGTGNSAGAAVDLLRQAGARDIRFLCLVAAPEGVNNLTSRHPDLPIFTAALDTRLNEKGYILPGLGDAGDRMFGTN
ncbi:MAG: uracil phosphoribosyltransferase [Pseudomonadota bacterium]